MHLNNGNNSFSEIAQMSGIANTDWSWSTLFMDMDLDGYKDLMITNGLYQDVRNKDFEILRTQAIDSLKRVNKTNKVTPEFLLELANKIPKEKIRNYFFKNNRDLTFTNVSEDWGFTEKGITHGAAYADFDGDGDLDIILNHQNEPIEILESTAVDRGTGNYLNIKLEGTGGNVNAIHTQLEIKYGDDLVQSHETFPYRGYISSSQNITQFGLGPHRVVKELTVKFLSGKTVKMSDVKANQTLVIKESKGQVINTPDNQVASILKSKTMNARVGYQENDYDDYETEILIPYKLSSLGPAIAVGDVNGDQVSDMYVGGATGFNPVLMNGIQSTGFKLNESSDVLNDKASEDGDATFFDADGDGDLDLYVCSGSNEYPQGNPKLRDRLFLNDGKGNFSKGGSLPNDATSTHKVVAHDVDGDGDQDLFVGGRQVPGRYGASADSYLYLNDGKGNFTSSKQEVLKKFGMVTDATFANMDSDAELELVVAGEWMPITVFDIGAKAQLSPKSGSLSDSNGLWNTIEAVDVDGDGDNDLIAGNLGLNNKYKASKEKPFKVYVDDFDKNGSNDIYLGYFANDGVCYPVRGRQCSSQQMPFVKKKFESYEAFATASIADVLDDKLDDDSVAKEVYTFAHTVFINDGNGNFEAVTLPNEAQRSVVNDILVTNLDDDPEKEFFLVGNFYDREVETTRSDAGIGAIINYDGDGKFSVVPSQQMGQFANKDARKIVELQFPGKNIIAVANNHGWTQFFERCK